MPIFPLIFLLFLSVPLIEVYLFLKVGASIGIFWTIVCVVFTAVLGSVLIRIQGFSLLAQSRQQLASGQLPTDAVFSGACLLLAGALLLTPGFFTDTIGFLLLTPFLRGMAYQYFVARLKKPHSKNGGFNRQSAHKGQQSGEDIIEGEFRHDDDAENRKNLP